MGNNRLDMDYNTDRSHLILKEYGRNVQNLIKFIGTIEDREKRTQYVHTLIHLMKQVNPMVKDLAADSPQRIWDHIYVMSEFNLDIDGPFPVPDRNIMEKKPEIMEYRKAEVRFRHYGRNVEILVANALKVEDEMERKAAFVQIGRLMNAFYASFNRDNIDNLVIYDHLKTLSKGEVNLEQEIQENPGLFDNSVYVQDNYVPYQPPRENRNEKDFRKNNHHNNYKKKNKKKRN